MCLFARSFFRFAIHVDNENTELAVDNENPERAAETEDISERSYENVSKEDDEDESEFKECIESDAMVQALAYIEADYRALICPTSTHT